MASITQLSDGRVRVRAKVGGRVRQATCTAAEADTVALELTRRLEKELASPRAVDIFKKFLAHKKRRLAPLSYTRLESTVRTHIVPVISSLRWSELSTDTINRAINIDASYSTCKKIREAFSACDCYALDHGFSEKSIMRGVELTKKAPAPVVEVLSVADVARLKEHGVTDRYGVIYLLLLYTGLRAGEVCALTWDDIRGESVCVHATAIEHHGVSVESHPKSHSSVRSIPLCRDALCLLPRIRDFWPESHSTIIYSRHGGPVSPARLTKLFRLFCSRHGIAQKKNALHALRDTFASSLIDGGADLVTVSKLLGHSSSRVTEEHYIAVSDSRKKAAVELLHY